jgi:thiamine kinase-like enzyme
VVLGGGITNHNFRVRLGGTDYVLRVPGRETAVLGIDRAAEAEATALAASFGIGPEVVARIGDPPALLTRFIAGRVMTAEDLRGQVGDVARALRRFHDSGATLRTEFDVVAIAQDYALQARGRGVEPPAGYQPALEHARAIQARLTGSEHAPVPCHNDLLAANFIDSGGHVRIVDWEYAAMGDRYFDLGNFAVNNGLGAVHEELFIEAYWEEPPTMARLSALRGMRFLSDLREAMWGVLQSAVSQLDFDFTAYAAMHFERLERARAG